jgi:hypothetical protein
MQASLVIASGLRTREDVRRYIAARKARTVDEIPSVRFWRSAGQATLVTLLLYAGMQYYYLHVFVEIMSLPSLTVMKLH